MLYLSLLCIASLVASMLEGMSACSVTPSAAAVVAGDDLSLTCTARGQSELIETWKFGSDTAGAKLLYEGPSYNQYGFIIANGSVADGYLANNSYPNQVILTITKTSIDQAEYYYCSCKASAQSSDSAFVSVLGVNGCTVTPSAAAVVAGDDLPLTCTARGQSELIETWKLGSDSANALVLYRSRGHSLDGSIRNRTVADGYLANDTDPRQVILTITKASTDQAESYYCTCVTEESIQSSDFAVVSVLVSEPTFSNATEITDGELVIFTCSVSFSGLANVSLTIKDSFGSKLSTIYYAVTTKGLHRFSLECNTTANSSISQEYSCNITLTNDTSSTTIYSKRVESSVQWVPVRNVRINPISASQCLNDKQCGINQAVQCTAEGNPKPVTFQWLVSINGSGFTMDETSGENFTFENVGQHTVQCIAFNVFHGNRYSSSSSNFTTQVVVDGPHYTTPGASQSSGTTQGSKSALIVGLVVGLGGAAIIITIVITVAILRKRKKSQQTKMEMYTTLDMQGSATSGMPQQPVYTALNVSSVGSEPPIDQRVAAETYETVIVNSNGDKSL